MTVLNIQSTEMDRGLCCMIGVCEVYISFDVFYPPHLIATTVQAHGGEYWILKRQIGV